MRVDAWQNGTANWWRWPLVPLASLLGASLVAVFYYLWTWLSINMMGGGSDGWIVQFITPLFVACIFSYALVWCGCFVAPRAKFITGVVITTLFVMYLFVGAYQLLFSTDFATGRKVLLSIQAVVGIISAIIAVYMIREEEQRKY